MFVLKSFLRKKYAENFHFIIGNVIFIHLVMAMQFSTRTTITQLFKHTISQHTSYVITMMQWTTIQSNGRRLIHRTPQQRRCQ